MSVLDVLRQIYINLDDGRPGEQNVANAATEGAAALAGASFAHPEGRNEAIYSSSATTDQNHNQNSVPVPMPLGKRPRVEGRGLEQLQHPEHHQQQEREPSRNTRLKAKTKTESKKRKRKKDGFHDDEYFEWTDELMEAKLSPHLEAAFATTIFELGLKHSSPKVLMKLMPDTEQLTTEHIKSHLQKYRLHYARSKEEFQEFYDLRLKDKFRQFCTVEGWRSLQVRSDGEEGEEEEEEDLDEKLSGLLEANNVQQIQDLSSKIVHEQMQLQQILQYHLMAQVKLQEQIHEQLTTLRDTDG